MAWAFEGFYAYCIVCQLGGNMGEREKVTWEELAWSNHVEQEALVRILVSKGIITQEELLTKVKQVQ